MANHLLIFARHPALGLVKTRLAATLGNEEALRIYRELLARTRIAADGVVAHKTLWLAGEAPATGSEYADWTNYEQRPQSTGDLGERMHQAFATAFAGGVTAAVIIGTDCPELSSDLLQAAFEQLTTHDVVAGPARDGGYYLLGMKALVPDFFANKAWSTDAVLSATLADAERLGLSVALLPMLSDVDNAKDFAAWQERAAAAVSQ